MHFFLDALRVKSPDFVVTMHIVGCIFAKNAKSLLQAPVQISANLRRHIHRKNCETELRIFSCYGSLKYTQKNK